MKSTELRTILESMAKAYNKYLSHSWLIRASAYQLLTRVGKPEREEYRKKARYLEMITKEEYNMLKEQS